MLKLSMTLLPILLLLSLTCVSIVQVNAQATEQILAEMFPSQGGVNTTILLRFTSLNTSVQNVESADIFWDNRIISLDQQGVPGASDTSENYNVTVPADPPYSDIGNHTIRVESTVVPYGPVTFYFTFNITEFVPSPEFLALNATYYSLLTNYTNILGNYTQLQADFNELLANNTILLDLYNNDTQNYNALKADYNVLNSNYNSLSANYNYLSNIFGNLTNVYGSLASSFQTLDGNYTTLIQDYNQLNSSYATLISNYNSLTSQLDLSRNLNIAFIITTIALAIAAYYFASIKPKRIKESNRVRSAR